MSVGGAGVSATAATAPSAPQPEAVPWLGLAAVLLGTFISTLTGRLSSFGLADIEGQVHAGFDEGAWITTSQTAAQMLITPFAVWAGLIYGPRQILLAACAVFALAEFLLPLSPNLPTLLALQFVSGLGSGCFIPLALGFILRRMPRRLWSYAIALYGLNLDLSIHISASLEGWYVDHGLWHWMFWQNVPLAIAMALCLYFGVRLTPPAGTPSVDAFGLAAFGSGLALIYAALDQGNRLDWFNSGLIRGLILGGAVLLVAFYLHVRRNPNAWINLHAVLTYPLPILFVLIMLLRSSILSTAFLVPQFLGSVRGFRALEVGGALVWVALPQLLIFPLAGFLLRFVDPRTGAAVGFFCIAVACLLVAYGLTPLWGSDQFLLSQLLQAVGQSMAITGVVFTGVLNIRLETALTFGAMLQTARLFGGELGQAFTTTFQRVREQRASNLIGQHVQAHSGDVIHRLQQYGHVVARASGLEGHTAAASVSLLSRAVRSMAVTQSVIDSFVVLAAAALAGLLCLVLLNAPPGAPSLGQLLLRKLRGAA
jgi:DHA2 family multidrug resistance protein